MADEVPKSEYGLPDTVILSEGQVRIIDQKCPAPMLAARDEPNHQLLLYAFGAIGAALFKEPV